MRCEEEEEEEEEKALGSSTKIKVKKKNTKNHYIHTYKEKSLSCSYLSKLICFFLYLVNIVQL